MVNEPTKQSHSNYHDEDKEEGGVVSSVPSRDASSLESPERQDQYVHPLDSLTELACETTESEKLMMGVCPDGDS